MKKQIILSTLFTFFTTSVGLLTLPGVANAEQQKFRDEESSRADRNQPRSSQHQQKRDSHTSRDKLSRTEKAQPRSSRQQLDRDRQSYRQDYDNRRDSRGRYESRPRYQDHTYYRHRPVPADRSRVSKRPYKVIISPPRHYYRGIVILNPHRHYYPDRYRPLYLKKDNVWAWIALTAITLKVLDNLNDQQQREHEQALHGAISIPLDETVTWSRGEASGAVTPVWEGRSNTGEYCREFRQEVSIGDRTEVAYGTACRRADGSWEIVD